jgi:hypothetical protein
MYFLVAVQLPCDVESVHIPKKRANMYTKTVPTVAGLYTLVFSLLPSTAAPGVKRLGASGGTNGAVADVGPGDVAADRSVSSLSFFILGSSVGQGNSRVGEVGNDLVGDARVGSTVTTEVAWLRLRAVAGPEAVEPEHVRVVL